MGISGHAKKRYTADGTTLGNSASKKLILRQGSTYVVSSDEIEFGYPVHISDSKVKFSGPSTKARGELSWTKQVSALVDSEASSSGFCGIWEGSNFDASCRCASTGDVTCADSSTGSISRDRRRSNAQLINDSRSRKFDANYREETVSRNQLYIDSPASSSFTHEGASSEESLITHGIHPGIRCNRLNFVALLESKGRGGEYANFSGRQENVENMLHSKQKTRSRVDTSCITTVESGSCIEGFTLQRNGNTLERYPAGKRSKYAAHDSDSHDLSVLSNDMLGVDIIVVEDKAERTPKSSGVTSQRTKEVKTCAASERLMKALVEVKETTMNLLDLENTKYFSQVDSRNKDHFEKPRATSPDYILSSGRLSLEKDAQLGRRLATIDHDFEEYFSALIL